MKTMDKEFVPYDLALELKTLGFDEPCLGFYDGKGDSKLYFNNLRDASGDFKPFIRSERLTWFGTPTFSQAFRWFREKHGLQGYIYSTTVRGKKDGDRYFSDYCWNINGIDMPFMKTDARDMERVTYEEAELACLRKLIEIVKHSKTT